MDDEQIRLAREDELPALALMRWNWSIVERGAIPVVDQSEFLDAFTAWAVANAHTHRCFVVESGGRLIAMAWLAVTPRVPSALAPIRSSADLQSVYVVPEARNAGVGRRLIEAVSAAAAQLGTERITAHTTEASVQFYDRLGYHSSDALRHLKL
jgi:GNAT superfamily N-acetyltransferase